MSSNFPSDFSVVLSYFPLNFSILSTSEDVINGEERAANCFRRLNRVDKEHKIVETKIAKLIHPRVFLSLS